MQFRYFKPPPELEQVVWCFWSLDGSASAADPFISTPPANSFANLLFHYKGKVEEVSPTGEKNNLFTCGIHAQTNTYRQISINSDFGVFGVFLYPYAIPVFFDIAASELCNRLPDLFSLLGNKGNEIEEQMMLASDDEQRLQIVTTFLKNTLTAFKNPQIIEAIRHVYRVNGMIDVDELADQTFLSKRQFERTFKEHTGFAPKMFSRIVRFNALIGGYKKQNRSLSHAAYDFGYYDQSHLIRDFKEFSGINPKAFFLKG